MVAISLLAGRPVLADEPLVTPGAARAAEPATGTDTQSGAAAPAISDGYLIFFEKPGSFWDDATSQTWTLKESTGKVICELPCTSWVRYPWSTYVEGSATWPDISRSTLRLALSDTFADMGFVVQNEPTGKTLWARPNPGKGCPDCALGLGIASGVFLAGAVGFLVWFALNTKPSSPDDGNLGVAVFGLGGAAILGLVGVSLGVAALVWGGLSARPQVEVFSAPPSSGNPSPIRVSFSSSGLALSF
jgi:hypothetical protein